MSKSDDKQARELILARRRIFVASAVATLAFGCDKPRPDVCLKVGVPPEDRPQPEPTPSAAVPVEPQPGEPQPGEPQPSASSAVPSASTAVPEPAPSMKPRVCLLVVEPPQDE